MSLATISFGPISAVPCRAKESPLRPRRSYFTPIRYSGLPGILSGGATCMFEPEHLVEVPGTAPGSDGFITTTIYRHSRPCGRQFVYNVSLAKLKDVASVKVAFLLTAGETGRGHGGSSRRATAWQNVLSAAHCGQFDHLVVDAAGRCVHLITNGKNRSLSFEHCSVSALLR